MRIKKVTLSKNSILSNTSYNYEDSYQGNFTDKNNCIQVLDATKAFFSTSPKWINSLLSLRNKIVAVFGLKTVEMAKSEKEILANFKGNPEDKLGLFKVYEKTDSEIILGEDDKHLNFRVSFMLDAIKNNEKKLTISTTVLYNNWFGKLYFYPVKPFHKIIVKTILKSMITEIKKQV